MDTHKLFGYTTRVSQQWFAAFVASHKSRGHCGYQVHPRLAMNLDRNEPSGNGCPILVVDDSPLNLKLARRLLTSVGYDARGAVDAEDAMRVLEYFEPCLIVMDLQLPGIDGIELTRRLKADPARRHIAIVAFTAYAMNGDAHKALAAGCDGYITKPIDPDRFHTDIARYLAEAVDRRQGGR